MSARQDASRLQLNIERIDERQQPLTYVVTVPADESLDQLIQVFKTGKNVFGLSPGPDYWLFHDGQALVGRYSLGEQPLQEAIISGSTLMLRRITPRSMMMLWMGTDAALRALPVVRGLQVGVEGRRVEVATTLSPGFKPILEIDTENGYFVAVTKTPTTVADVRNQTESHGAGERIPLKAGRKIGVANVYTAIEYAPLARIGSQ